MKNALNLFLVLIMCFFTLGCSKDVAANTNTALENAQSAQKSKNVLKLIAEIAPILNHTLKNITDFGAQTLNDLLGRQNKRVFV